MNTIRIAKMSTRYPDFHGAGYYNFLMAFSDDELREKVEDASHDFRLDGTVVTRFQSIDAVLKKYPSKYSLKEKYFKGE